ncbi:unnamed protein product [Hermetia illucens]|uniref:Uncharacterized protein n=2 Tax=Hermetia illucens TaxID=343691 RepID=A0A7R8YVP9_HERIL|nr:unnamed protein product [Hermetia illucens]
MASSKQNSVDEKVKLPVTETISRFYQPRKNRKAIRILTVAIYVLCVSLAAIMLSLYYIFIWDPTIKPFIPKVSSCDKIVIPENIAIRLLNSTEISAEQFYRSLQQYNHLLHRFKHNISTPYNHTLESYELQQRSFHHRRKTYRKQLRVTTTTLTTPPPTTTTTRMIPTLKMYQRKYLRRINKDDEDDLEEAFDGSGHFLAKESTESDLS